MCICKEKAKYIEGYPNYKISSKGRIYSKYMNRTMKIFDTKDGYKRICLCKNGKKKFFAVHRLVGLHFIPNPENNPQIDHKDGNKTNNCICNLHFVTASENAKNVPLTISNTSGHKHIHFDNIRKKWRFQIRIEGKKIHFGYFDSIELAIDLRDFFYEYILEKDLLEHRF